MEDGIPRPSRGVWEITYACNMHCRHCGSGCSAPLPDELSTAAALELADDLAALGVKAITLSGGEPFLRADWHLIARRLTLNGIATNVITNGWLLTDELLDQAIAAQISNILLSFDGTAENHDWLRKEGSYQRILQAFKLLQKRNISAACITTLSRKNVADLPAMKNVLIEHGVSRWQLQLAMPMGNLRAYPELVLAAKDLPAIIAFTKAVATEGKIIMYLGDNIGYHSSHGEELLRQGNTSETERYLNLSFCWQGCHAGKRIIGIWANGNITGCLALRDPSYIAGNIREQKLHDIWNHSETLKQLRNLNQSHLQGFCRTCPHGSTCLGGCAAHKTAFNNNIFAENPTCLYRFECNETGYGHND